MVNIGDNRPFKNWIAESRAELMLCPIVDQACGKKNFDYTRGLQNQERDIRNKILLPQRCLSQNVVGFRAFQVMEP